MWCPMYVEKIFRELHNPQGRVKGLQGKLGIYTSLARVKRPHQQTRETSGVTEGSVPQ